MKKRGYNADYFERYKPNSEHRRRIFERWHQHFRIVCQGIDQAIYRGEFYSAYPEAATLGLSEHVQWIMQHMLYMEELAYIRHGEPFDHLKRPGQAGQGEA
jgi:hypothetical protein